ncbi:MAG: ABC transporter permease [Alphaproteobacteria bacterium]|nr:ABC transporter permease [Alphaproteobacteria bacterium]
MTQLEAVSEPAADTIVDLLASSTRVALAVADIRDGFAQRWLWIQLAHQDMRLRYRGSMLGPFWQTITTVVLISSMGVIYSKLFHTPMKDYLPLLTVGLIIWNFIAGMITEGCGTFDAVRGIIQQVKLPFSLHAFRLVYRNILVLAHSFVIIPIVLIIFPHPIAWMRLVEIFPGLLLAAVNGVAISIFLGMICARFRDVPPIVASVVQVIFFLTPIMWPPAALGSNQWWAVLNPLYTVIDVVRSPLLGMPTSPHSWSILAIVTLCNCALSFMFFTRFRARIAFWV